MTKILWLLALACLAAAPAVAADHPGSGSDCAGCHTAGAERDGAPGVLPPEPGFWAKLMGEKPVRGHPSVSCAGVLASDGRVTGCHRPEDGRPGLLAIDLFRGPVDALCGQCHPGQRKPGLHHPSYKADRNRDGVPETIVRPAGGQEVFDALAPENLPEPVRSHPDALAFQALPDGTRQRIVALPLATVVEEVAGVRVEETGVVTCTTCHNPHHGYLVEAGSASDLDRDLVARESGDALLRLRDYDNALCDACH